MSASSWVLQFSSCNFDAVNIETMAVLIAGAIICVPSEKGRVNDLAREIRQLRVDWMGATATLACIVDPKEVTPQSALLVGRAQLPQCHCAMVACSGSY